MQTTQQVSNVFFIYLKETFSFCIFYCSLGSCSMHSAKAHCRISFNFSKIWNSPQKHRFSSHYHERGTVHRQYKQDAHSYIYYLEIMLVAAPSP